MYFFRIIIPNLNDLFFCRDRHRSNQSRRKRRQINENNNQNSLIPIDVAECIDEDFRFTLGLTILLSKGSILLDDDDDVQMVCLEFTTLQLLIFYS